MGKPEPEAGKPRARRQPASDTLWLFGLHAVRDALANPARRKLRLVVTRNALPRLAASAGAAGIAPEIADPRRFPAPLDPGSVHQGATLKVCPLDWGGLQDCCAPAVPGMVAVLLDRVGDPHNAGAILRSARAFGAVAVIAPHRHSAPETGALAKAASGALEHQPYLRVQNLVRAMQALQAMGYVLIGLDGGAARTLPQALAAMSDRPVGLVLGAEGPGLRHLTRGTCDLLARIPCHGEFASLNVSNAAAIALYAAAHR